MPTYAIVNPEAASGKSTTAVALAAHFGRFGADALVIDLDSNADATAALSRGRSGQLDQVLRGALPVAAALAAAGYPQVDLLAASPRLAQTAEALQESRPAGLEAALR